MFAFSAPGESPPPVSGNTRGTIRGDVAFEINRGIVKTQTAISDIYGILNSQQGAGGQPQSVSATHILSLAEFTLTVS